MGLAALTIVKKEELSLFLRVGAVILCSALAYYANWNFVGVLWIVFFGVFRGNFKKQMISFSIIAFLLHIVPTFTYLDQGWAHEAMPHWYQLFVFAAVPLLAMYNGRKGNGPRWLSPFFYYFYPAHLLLIYLINLLLR